MIHQRKWMQLFLVVSFSCAIQIRVHVDAELVIWMNVRDNCSNLFGLTAGG